MEIKTLTGIDQKEILKIFNVSFSDYFVPFRLTEDQFSSKMISDNIHLDVSVGVFEKGSLIAFVLHGLKSINGQKLIYNAGTGVAPLNRGQGLTKRMYHFILPILKEKEISSLILEVISKNIQAIKSYQKSGFETVRFLSCYKGSIKILETNSTIEVKRLNDYNWSLMESFWDILPTWQNSKGAVNTQKSNNISIGAYLKNQLVGYIIYNPNNKRLQQIAVNKKFRKNKIASTLIYNLKNKFGSSLSIINVDQNSKSTNSFFEQIGLINYLDQIEMKLQLDKNHN